jgi:hypothetical protein
VAGTARMYLMAPDELPVDPSFVRCAVEQGVRHIVLLSGRGIETMGDDRLMAAERTVRESGADWTIVRPDWFNQNFDEGFFLPAVLAGELALPLGDLRQARRSPRDHRPGVGPIGPLPGDGRGLPGRADLPRRSRRAEQAQREIEAFARLRELGDARPNGVVRQVTGREP